MKADLESNNLNIGYSRPDYGPAFASREKVNEEAVESSELSVSSATAQAPVRQSENNAQTSVKDFQQATDIIKEFIGKNQRDLSFDRDSESGMMIISVMDGESKDVIRKIPSEEAIKIASQIKNLHDEIISTSGMIFEDKA